MIPRTAFEVMLGCMVMGKELLLLHIQIEEFWQLYNNIKTPDEMEQNSNFHFFKRGIKPLWEHSANLDGGKWVVTIKNDTNSLAKSWLEVVSFKLILEHTTVSHIVSLKAPDNPHNFSIAVAAFDWWL